MFTEFLRLFILTEALQVQGLKGLYCIASFVLLAGHGLMACSFLSYPASFAMR